MEDGDDENGVRVDQQPHQESQAGRQAMELAWTRDDGRRSLGFLLTYHHHQSHIPRRQQMEGNREDVSSV
jgi:hypothetical protein